MFITRLISLLDSNSLHIMIAIVKIDSKVQLELLHGSRSAAKVLPRDRANGGADDRKRVPAHHHSAPHCLSYRGWVCPPATVTPVCGPPKVWGPAGVRAQDRGLQSFNLILSCQNDYLPTYPFSYVWILFQDIPQRFSSTQTQSHTGRTTHDCGAHPMRGTEAQHETPPMSNIHAPFPHFFLLTSHLLFLDVGPLQVRRRSPTPLRPCVEGKYAE